MLFWFAAAAASALPAPAHAPQGPGRPTIQARATVRIISGARVRLGPEQDQGRQDGDVPPQRATVIVADGSTRPARLIEFE
jgi:hypothetical protein